MHNKEYVAKYYKNHPEKVKKAVHERRKQLATWFREYKKTLQCSRCSENHWACLDFHHPDGRLSNDLNPSKMIANGWSKERILKELNKRIILCANCHRKEHYK